jgi:hypothetical protein
VRVAKAGGLPGAARPAARRKAKPAAKPRRAAKSKRR